MPKAGDRYFDKNGYGVIFRQTGHETNGGLREMEVTYGPSSTPPPQHFHPSQEEHFEVVSGELQVLRGPEVTIYKSGDTFTIPPRVAHGMHNTTEGKTRVIWQTRPALNSANFYKLTWGGNPKIDADTPGWRQLLQFGVLFLAYRKEIRLAGLPDWVQLILIGILAPIGWLFGYRSKYDS